MNTREHRPSAASWIKKFKSNTTSISPDSIGEDADDAAAAVKETMKSAAFGTKFRSNPS